MLKQESNNISNRDNNRGARACDTCRSTICTVYCHADSAYLCTSCDAQVHSANRVASRHKRVPVCESCERAPAAFMCEADDVSLCTACDSEVHSANPLARRHQRVPVVPITGNSCSSLATPHHTSVTEPEKRAVLVQDDREGKEDAKETASWVFPYSDKVNHNNNNQNNELLFSDDYLDLADYNSSMDYKFTGDYNQHQHKQDCTVPQTNYGGDRVVPLQLEETRGNLRHKQQNITYGSSGSQYNYNGSINHNANNPSMQTDFVPEPTARVTTASHQKTPKETIHQPPEPLVQMLSPMDREARVLRYREKRKRRKFEKTIRYASRKAYAERRPRINGRFAKMSETEVEDQEFNTMLMYHDTGYGIVPSFYGKNKEY
ncbi:Zinc finger protein CONSTANS [Raphanus sativus]|uniref:Zinc finger protein CONSTANS n=1 Tax=Raphanus sativus TaxID=3726 RepID=A0A6J0KD23_RAPSA|nr:zinc finger protein CONSTANS [Raphanus sativus]KAJ4882731.1 Zinc finger protein CONSTANS [Raphanus sativus]